MPLNIRDEDANRLAEELANRMHTTKTAAVKHALRSEIERMDRGVPLRQRVRALQERVLARPPTGLDADKAFYDALSGQQ
ncbi:MAG TPA: type II toxin-antitoxin system VapB family antitoxin [Acetobacteraceae bacterium]|jgi:antitoxin VapB